MEKIFSVTGTKAGIEITKGAWRAKFDTTFGTPKGHVFGTTILPEINEKNEETKNSHAGNKSRKLNPRPKKAIFTRRPKREISLKVESKKIDLIQDEDDMENEYVLPFELKEEEGKNEVHLEGEYYEEETIEFFKEDHFEEPVKLFENYHDEYPDDTIEFVEEPTQQDVIEDISINVSKD